MLGPAGVVYSFAERMQGRTQGTKIERTTKAETKGNISGIYTMRYYKYLKKRRRRKKECTLRRFCRFHAHNCVCVSSSQSLMKTRRLLTCFTCSPESIGSTVCNKYMFHEYAMCGLIFCNDKLIRIRKE
jgi:hypothetical protein